MVIVHAAILKPREQSRYQRGWSPSTWGAVCGSLGTPISDQIERVTCDDCKRIIKQRGIVL